MTLPEKLNVKGVEMTLKREKLNGRLSEYWRVYYERNDTRTTGYVYLDGYCVYLSECSLESGIVAKNRLYKKLCKCLPGEFLPETIEENNKEYKYKSTSTDTVVGRIWTCGYFTDDGEAYQHLVVNTRESEEAAYKKLKEKYRELISAGPNKHEFKMYVIVLRHLNGLNKGIQTAHAVCEYIRKYKGDDDLEQWLSTDKTLVVLDGGSSYDLKDILEKFNLNNVKYATFEEEDLNGITTCICVLADERVWDRKEYGSKTDFIEMKRNEVEPEESEDPTWKEAEERLAEEIEREVDRQYSEFVGGNTNVVKKEVLNNLRLAL
jgi:hypothetical protein